MTIFDHIKQLTSNLNAEERQALSRFLAEPANQESTLRKPRSLRGVWQDKFPRDPDIDLALDESS